MPPSLPRWGRPFAPANLAATAGDADVTLSWEDPDDDSITGYEYNVNHNATSTGNFTGWSTWQSISGSDADTTSHTITGLANGREYRYHLRAVNAAGTGSVAPDAHPWFVSATPGLPPAAPAGLAATAGDGSVTLAWDDPSDSSITGYEYSVNHNDTLNGRFRGWGQWQAIVGSGASTTSHTTEGLTNGKEYRYRVRAVNDVGAGARAPDSAPGYVSAEPAAPVAPVDPAAVPELSVSEPTSNTMTLTLRNYSASWYYKRQAASGQAAAESASACSSQVELEYIYVHGLSAGTTYTFTAYRDAQCTTPVGAQTSGTTGSPPGGGAAEAQSGGAPPAPQKVYRYRVCDSMMMGYHSVPGATSYNINYSTYGKWWSWIRIKTRTTHNWWYADHFNRNKTWWFAVQTMNGDVEGGWTESAPGVAPPCPPTDVKGSWKDGGIEISWTHGKRTAAYDLSHSTDGGANWTTIATNAAASGAGTTYQWNEADPTKIYVFAVRSRFNDIPSSWVNSQPVSPPTLTATGITVTSATLTLANHTGSWWLKQTAPSTGTCTAGEADFSHALSNLTAGVAHAYTAYSARNCPDGKELASETFVTPVSVSNISQTHFGTGPVGKESGNDREAAQEFTTGLNSGGYTLSSITIHTAAKTGTPADFVLTLNASGNTPGSVVATLSGSNPDTAGSHTYTCSGTGCDLAPDTTYFIVMKATGSTGHDNRYLINTTQSDNETLMPSGNGWSIANRSFTLQGGWLPNPTVAYRVEVIATPNPSLTPSDISATTASLSLTGRLGDWWVKQTAPTQGTCTFVATASAYEHRLSSLTANTEYTYKAYGDDGCTRELASATFTTPYSLTAGNVTSTSATLTLAGHTGQWWYPAGAAPDDSCTDAGSGATTVLSGLTSNTAYTYTAYSDGTCSTALASAVVSTYSVTAGNLDKPVYLESCRVSSLTHCAVGFTTGSNSGGYTLASITARFKSKTHPPGSYLGDIVVTLHESASNSVGDMKRPADAERATLAGRNPDSAGDYTYTCAAGGGNNCTLAANTTYFVEFAASGGGGTTEGYNWATTESDDENLNPAGNGWSLANGTDFHVDGRAWLAEYADTGLLLVSATAN